MKLLHRVLQVRREGTLLLVEALHIAFQETQPIRVLPIDPMPEVLGFLVPKERLPKLLLLCLDLGVLVFKQLLVFEPHRRELLDETLVVLLETLL